MLSFKRLRRLSWPSFQRTFLIHFKSDLSSTSGIELCRVSLIPSQTGYLENQVMWGTLDTELDGVSRYPIYVGYLGYRVMRGTPNIELDGVPQWQSYVGYLGYRIVWGTSATELCRVPWIPNSVGYLGYRVMWGLLVTELWGVPQIRTVISRSHSDHRHVTFYYNLSCFSPNSYNYLKKIKKKVQLNAVLFSGNVLAWYKWILNLIRYK